MKITVMKAIDLLLLETEQAYRELTDTLQGISEGHAWAVPPQDGPGYLHTSGSILEIVQHIATCKVMYGSAAFRDTAVRWRDCAARLDAIGADWQQNLAYLRESHDGWVACWSALGDDELLRLRSTNWGEQWPTWRIISTISQHDTYHAGQIALLHASLPAVSVPPPSHADAIRRHLQDQSSVLYDPSAQPPPAAG
ncbi:MAG TPA: DinB family protein [Gemmatimonadales bacterium]|nr:DinB family protein [Gemmatimonadales bacterium]